MWFTKLSTLHSFMAEHQQFLSYSIKGIPLVYLNPAINTPTFTKAMNGPDCAGFLKAMESKMTTLIEMKTFDFVKHLSKHKVISSMWVFKVKRFPDGSVNKLKAQLCARGFEQIEGQDYLKPSPLWCSG